VNRHRWIVLCTLVLGGSGCAATPAPFEGIDCGTEGSDTGTTPTFAAVQALFVRRCAAGAACHGAGSALVLVGPSVYDDLVGRPSMGFAPLPRVDPGHPERSFLWLKLDGCFTELSGCSSPGNGCGVRMPPLSPISEGFDPSEAAIVREWIAAGAAR